MPRDTARKVEVSPNLEHINVQRDFTGSVTMTNILNTSGLSATATGGEVVTSVATEQLVCFSSMQCTLTSGNLGSATTPVTWSVTVNGTTTLFSKTGQTDTSTSGTTLSQQTHTTPLNNPTWNLNATVAGGTATGFTLDVDVENKWA